jgi:forespore regulator of the sigma-K checkpoint
VGFSNLIKQLKKQLRKQLKSGKRRLMLGSFLVLIGLASIVVMGLVRHNSFAATASGNANGMHALMPETKQQLDVLQQIETRGGEHEVFAQKMYVCGQETAKVGRLKAGEITRYHLAHPQDNMKLTAQGEVFFIEQVEDLSAKCKQNAFFGLDKNGNLTLFDGLPNHEQVIRTFFQLNVEHLKTSLPRGTLDQLKKGIRVSDLAEYNSVLSTFSDYAISADIKS